MRDTIDMAREAEIYVVRPDEFQSVCIDDLKRFEALVRSDEREACAKVCVKIALEFKSMYCGDEMEAAFICEENIRARGDKA